LGWGALGGFIGDEWVLNYILSQIMVMRQKEVLIVFVS